MKPILILPILAFLTSGCAGHVPLHAAVGALVLASAMTPPAVEVSLEPDGDWAVAWGRFIRLPDPDIKIINTCGLDDDDLPVALYLASRSRVSLDTIVRWRQGGWDWMAITWELGLEPGIYYVAVDEDLGGCYGTALKHFHARPHSHWRHIRLKDHEIRDLVHLRLVVDRYGCPGPEIAR